MSPLGASTAWVGMLNGWPSGPGLPLVLIASSTSPVGASFVLVWKPVSAS